MVDGDIGERLTADGPDGALDRPTGIWVGREGALDVEGAGGRLIPCVVEYEV